MGSALTVFILPVLISEALINENANCTEHVLETLHKSDFDSIYSLITTLLRSNSLSSEEGCQIALAFLTNKENRSHFLEDNRFCQVICKYTSAITNQEMKALVAHKALRLLISKVNVETLGKFDAVSIARYQRHCAQLLTSILRTCTRMKSVDDNQEFHSDDERDRLELGDALP